MVKLTNQKFKDGSVIETTESYLPLKQVKKEREFNLLRTDLLMIADNFEALSSEQQTELKALRKKWRDIPNDANQDEEKCEFPSIPTWLKNKNLDLFEY
tara:strand:+ start:527 stop:823 length:297 start_codon:yes stop_codon:yes gene_type:complete